MLFEERWLTLLSRAISNFTQLYDCNKYKLNLQFAAWRSQQSCTMEILTDFWNKIHYIDKHESLTCKAIFVPKPGKRSTPLVTVSKPCVLAFSAQKWDLHTVETPHTSCIQLWSSRISLNLQMLTSATVHMTERCLLSLWTSLTTQSVVLTRLP